MLELENVYKSFRGKEVLRGVSLRVEKGEIHVVLGPNGAGKTTLIRIALGVLLPDKGTVKLLGRAPRDRGVKRFVGYLGERLGLLPYLTARQELELACLSKGLDVEACSELVEEVASLLGLAEVLDRPIATLSLGTRQRVGIARALIGDPKLLVLDEPFRGLDRDWSLRLIEILKRFVSSGRAILIASHVLQEPLLDDAEATLLMNGHVVARGRVREVLRLWPASS